VSMDWGSWEERGEHKTKKTNFTSNFTSVQNLELYVREFSEALESFGEGQEEKSDEEEEEGSDRNNDRNRSGVKFVLDMLEYFCPETPVDVILKKVKTDLGVWFEKCRVMFYLCECDGFGDGEKKITQICVTNNDETWPEYDALALRISNDKERKGMNEGGMVIGSPVMVSGGGTVVGVIIVSLPPPPQMLGNQQNNNNNSKKKNFQQQQQVSERASERAKKWLQPPTSTKLSLGATESATNPARRQ